MDNNDGDIFFSIGKDDYSAEPFSADPHRGEGSHEGSIRDFDKSIITARGTGDGLVIRIDGRAQRSAIKEAFVQFVASRKRFLAGNNITLEWIGELPPADFVAQLTEHATSQQIDISSSQLKEMKKGLVSSIESSPGSASVHSVNQNAAVPTNTQRGLFGGMEGYNATNDRATSVTPRFEKYTSKLGEANFFDEADARVIASTIRGGQRIETEHSIVVFGDVNSGAELIAGGDIIVLGTLRGVAHAGAYDETGGGRVIFALNLQPTQLRIGAVISRGNTGESGKAAEIARVDGSSIVVEPYQARAMLSRRKDM